MTAPGNNTAYQVKHDWWDGNRPDSFFHQIYQEGDNSFEGHLLAEELTRPARTLKECRLVEKLLGLSAGAKILDCPCGFGRHSLELARRGYAVSGLDLHPNYIREADKAATPAALSCTFQAGDMRQMPFAADTFDHAINMFFSFGFFDEAGNRQVLSEFARVLRPGGKLLIHTDVNPDLIQAGEYGDRSRRTLVDGNTLLIEEHYNPGNRRLEGKWVIRSPEGREREAHYSVRIYEHDELRALAAGVGFSRMDIHAMAQEVAYVLTK
jgi:SAM-dependent methyltransferase